VAKRNEPAIMRQALSRLGAHAPPSSAPRHKPPQEREIVTAVAVPSEPETALGAVAELMEHGAQFALFCHARTSEDVVVHLRSDDAVGLLHPPGGALNAERDLVVPQPSRYPDPIGVADARSEMDVLDHRFVYFIAAEDRRGKVLYLRRDGDYGLVELK
jgi:Sigma 54 modulation/S30EA ribosomal protein C terminus